MSDVSLARVEGPSALAETSYRAGVMGLANMSEQEFETRLKSLRAGLDRLQMIHKSLMERDVDFGVIPGTPKPTLFKPGAEKLFQFYGLVPCFKRDIKYGDGVTAPPISVISTCEVRVGSDQGPTVAEATGACSSFEKKYRYRRGERACPTCGVIGSINKSRDKPEFYCWAKKGGCGATFPLNDTRITEQAVGDIDNPDPFELLNTIVKMADKRAMVAAALAATASSGLYTQDLEDMPESDRANDSRRETTSSGNGNGHQAANGSSTRKTETKADTSQLKCSHEGCGKALTQAQYDVSVRNFKAPLCPTHQKQSQVKPEDTARTGFTAAINKRFPGLASMSKAAAETMALTLAAVIYGEPELLPFAQWNAEQFNDARDKIVKLDDALAEDLWTEAQSRTAGSTQPDLEMSGQ